MREGTLVSKFEVTGQDLQVRYSNGFVIMSVLVWKGCMYRSFPVSWPPQIVTPPYDPDFERFVARNGDSLLKGRQ